MIHNREEFFALGSKSCFFRGLPTEYSPSICRLHVSWDPFECLSTLRLMTLSLRLSQCLTT